MTEGFGCEKLQWHESKKMGQDQGVAKFNWIRHSHKKTKHWRKPDYSWNRPDHVYEKEKKKS